MGKHPITSGNHHCRVWGHITPQSGNSERWILALSCLFSFLCNLGAQKRESYHIYSGWVFLSTKLFWKHLVDTQTYVSMVILSPVRLTIKMNLYFAATSSLATCGYWASEKFMTKEPFLSHKKIPYEILLSAGNSKSSKVCMDPWALASQSTKQAKFFLK